ncbi:MAG: TonB-dependent siderophore receptor [Methyloligella sp. ZOD6]
MAALSIGGSVFAQENGESGDETLVQEEGTASDVEHPDAQDDQPEQPSLQEEEPSADAAGATDHELPEITVQAPYEAPPARPSPTPAATPQTAAPARVETEAELEASATDDMESAYGPVDGIVATRSATGMKTDTPIVEIPQTVSVITADQIEVQGAQTISQALRYTPGLLTQPNGASSVYDESRIRGFTPLYYLDGMVLPLDQFFATPRMEPFGLERIEVLQGPASVLYGQNSPGGLVNMVSKKPTEDPFGEIELQTGSHDRRQGAFDIGGPVDKNEKVLYRLTMLARDAGTEVDYTKDNRFFIAPALTFKPDADTELTILTSYGKDESDYPHQYLPAQGTLRFNPNGRIPRSRNVGEPSWDDFDREQWWVGYAFEHRLNDTWQVRQNLRYASVDVDFDALRGEGLLPDMRTLIRSAVGLRAAADTFTVDNQLQGDFRTGALEHTMVFGLDYLRTDADFRQTLAFPVAPIDIYNPTYGAPIPPLAATIENSQLVDQTGVYLQDQIKLDRWILTLGGRHDWASAEVQDYLAGTAASQNDSDFSWRAGLGYMFDNGLTPYFSYSTSFQPQIGISVDGTPFDPATGEQYEVGIKYQPVGTDALFTIAAFDLTRENFLTQDPVTFISRQNGKARVRGIELEAKVSLTDHLVVIASYAYLDSKITESDNPLEIGRPLELTPENQASAWLDYMFDRGVLDGLRVGGGVRYVGNYLGETVSADPIVVPSYTLFDAMVSYDLGKFSPKLDGTELALNLTNLSDEYYVTYCYTEVYCSLGQGRMVLGSLRYRW